MRGGRERVGQPAGRIIYAGTYEWDYPRNALTIAALRRAGYAVDEVHAPVWELTRDKTGRVLSLPSLARLGFRLVRSYISLAARLGSKLRRADAVVIGYPGQVDMLALAPLVHLGRRPLIFNPLVTLTDTLVEDRELVPSGGIAARAIALLDRLALNLATVVLVDAPENGDYLTEHFGVAPGRIQHLNVGADDRLFRPRPDPERSDATLRVLFYGKYTPLHGIETIIRAAKALEDEAGVSFEVIGDGQTAPATHELARNLEMRSVAFVPWVPFERLPERISEADVVLGIFGDTAKAARVVPNKVYQAMAMGAAIVTRDGPAIRRVLVDGHSALLVPPDDPDALAAAILRLRDRGLRRTLGRNAHAAFEATGSVDALSSRIAAILADLAPVARVPAPRLERGR